jgi:thioredoxin
MSDNLTTLTDQNWETEVLAASGPVLVDFWAQWCKPCLAMVPDLEAVAAKYDGKLRVGKINVEENDQVPFRYSITSLPTILLIKGGQVLEQRIGKLSKEALIKLLDPHLG